MPLKLLNPNKSNRRPAEHTYGEYSLEKAYQREACKLYLLEPKPVL